MCDTCPPPDELYERIDRAIDERRWFMTGVGVGPPEHLKWLYTVGLSEQLDHPELLVVGVCCAPCGGNILNALAERVAAGERFDVPTAEPLTFDRGGLLHVRDVPEACWASSWFAMWLGYYREKPYAPPPARAVQVLFTDDRGRFPWEPGCDPAIAYLQRLTDAPREIVMSGSSRRRRRPTRPRRWDR